MNFEDITKSLINTLKKYQNMLIYIKGSPDPDAIASSFTLKVIGESLGVKSSIIAFTETSLPQNKAIIKDLNIPIHFEKSNLNLSTYDAYSILDFQSAYIKGISEKIPCAIHIDHHEAIDELVKVDLKIVMPYMGSVSSIMALILKEYENKLDKHLLKNIATALQLGIYTDTNSLKHAGHLDYEAINYLSFYSNYEDINNIIDIPYSIEMIKFLGDAIKNQVVYKDWLITGIGFIDESYRDNIALIADFLLNREKITTVTVFAGIEDNNKKGLFLDASIRTDAKNIDLNEIIKQISPDGGARRFKGAYQIDLDYFAMCPDKKLLWDVIHFLESAPLHRCLQRVRRAERHRTQFGQLVGALVAAPDKCRLAG